MKYVKSPSLSKKFAFSSSLINDSEGGEMLLFHLEQREEEVSFASKRSQLGKSKEVFLGWEILRGEENFSPVKLFFPFRCENLGQKRWLERN